MGEKHRRNGLDQDIERMTRVSWVDEEFNRYWTWKKYRALLEEVKLD